MSYLQDKKTSLLNSIRILNSKKQQRPPIYVSSLLTPDSSLEEDLAGQVFKNLSEEKKRIIYSDVSVLNPKAFRYYIFDLLEDSLEKEELPAAFFMLILGLSKKSLSFDDRLDILTKKEKSLICEYMKYIHEYTVKSNNIDALDLREDFHKEINENVNFWCSEL